MKIYVYTKTPKGGVSIIRDFANTISDEVIYTESTDIPDCDAVVMWSILGHDKSSILYSCKRRNIPVIVLEVGGLKRNEYWRIGINGVNAEATYDNENSTSHRWDLLNLTLKPWRTQGDHILLCTQNERSSAWKLLPMEEYTYAMVEKIRQYTDRPIVIRMHPRARFNYTPSKNVTIENPKITDKDDTDLIDALKNCHAVINHNSNPSITAALNGIPVFVDKSSLAYPVNAGDISEIENPLMPDRSQWVYDLANIEWSVDEIKSGEPWERMRKLLDPS